MPNSLGLDSWPGWKGKDNTDKRPTFLINFAEDGFNLP